MGFFSSRKFIIKDFPPKALDRRFFSGSPGRKSLPFPHLTSLEVSFLSFLVDWYLIIMTCYSGTLPSSVPTDGTLKSFCPLVPWLRIFENEKLLISDDERVCTPLQCGFLYTVSVTHISPQTLHALLFTSVHSMWYELLYFKLIQIHGNFTQARQMPKWIVVISQALLILGGVEINNLAPSRLTLPWVQSGSEPGLPPSSSVTHSAIQRSTLNIIIVPVAALKQILKVKFSLHSKYESLVYHDPSVKPNLKGTTSRHIVWT